VAISVDLTEDAICVIFSTRLRFLCRLSKEERMILADVVEQKKEAPMAVAAQKTEAGVEGRILRLSTAEMSRPQSPVTRWFLSGGPPDRQRSEDNSHPWHSVLWLTGVDYFSSLAYQAGIA
jgi:hypothetical protein